MSVAERAGMKFLLIVHHNEAAFAAMSDSIKRDLLNESVQVTHELHAQGQYVDAAPLKFSASGARVHVRDGKVLVTDGPFVETHEHIAGYFLIHADSLSEAVNIAGRIPGARLGYVEVRQALDVDGLPVK
jgi:hypothetical protein